MLLEGAINVGNAVLRGWWDDLIEPDAPFDTLDELEFSAWLIKHGATPAIVKTSPAVRQVYDTSFQYDDGDPTRQNYAAGTALGVFTSLMTQYKGSILYLVQAGFGEAVVAPIYQTSSYSIWPKADNRVTFHWSALSAPPDVQGEKRLLWQFLRANIDPTECCVASGVGTTKYRLYPRAPASRTSSSRAKPRIPGSTPRAWKAPS